MASPRKLKLSSPAPRRERKTDLTVMPASEAVLLPATATNTMPGFTQFTEQDYTVETPDGKRKLTVSPLRAIMAEQAEAAEHVVTERTRQGVLYAAGLGIERKVIARILGVDLDVLEALYEAELETAVHLMMNDIQTNLYNIARDPTHAQSVRSGMFLLGKLGNDVYREQKARSTALTVNPQSRTIDPSVLTDDQRDALRQIIMSAMQLAAPSEATEGEYTEIEDDSEDDESVL